MEGSNTFASFLLELIQGNHKIILSCTTRSRILGSKHISNSFECVVSRLSTGRARSVLDLAQTRPANIGWRAEGPKTNCRHQSVESVLGSGGARVGSVGGKVHRKLQNFAGNYKFLAEICKFLLKFIVIWPNLAKSYEISPDLAWSCQIWPDSVYSSS